MPKKIKEQGLPLLPDHIGISAYCKLKSISRSTLYYHVKQKRILLDHVGRNAIPMIDLNQYDSYTFNS